MIRQLTGRLGGAAAAQGLSSISNILLVIGVARYGEGRFDGFAGAWLAAQFGLVFVAALATEPTVVSERNQLPAKAVASGRVAAKLFGFSAAPAALVAAVMQDNILAVLLALSIPLLCADEFLRGLNLARRRTSHLVVAEAIWVVCTAVGVVLAPTTGPWMPVAGWLAGLCVHLAVVYRSAVAFERGLVPIDTPFEWHQGVEGLLNRAPTMTAMGVLGVVGDPSLVSSVVAVRPLLGPESVVAAAVSPLLLASKDFASALSTWLLAGALVAANCLVVAADLFGVSGRLLGPDADEILPVSARIALSLVLLIDTASLLPRSRVKWDIDSVHRLVRSMSGLAVLGLGGPLLGALVFGAPGVVWSLVLYAVMKLGVMTRVAIEAHDPIPQSSPARRER